MNTYIIKPHGYPFEVEVTESQLKEYAESVANSIEKLVYRLDDAMAFYDEGVTIGELWPHWTEWEGMEFDLPYHYDSIVINGEEKSLIYCINQLELTFEDRKEDIDKWCEKLTTELFNAIISK